MLKGGLSSLYGTGAAAGVINIILRKESKELISGSANMEYGSFNTFTSSANVNGTSGNVSYLFTGAYKTSDGFSAAQDTLGTEDFDDDGITSSNFLGKFGYQLSPEFSVGLMAAYDKVKSDFDGGAFTDNDSEFEMDLVKVGLSTSYEWAGGSLQSNFSYHSNERIFNFSSFS